MNENDEYVATLLAKIRDLEDENKKLKAVATEAHEVAHCYNPLRKALEALDEP